MPVTARLSRRFYEALGDEIANELVDWFNAVDLTYRTELRDLNELRQEILGLRADMDVGLERVTTAIERSRTDLLRWMFALWLTSTGATILSRLL